MPRRRSGQARWLRLIQGACGRRHLPDRVVVAPLPAGDPERRSALGVYVRAAFDGPEIRLVGTVSLWRGRGSWSGRTREPGSCCSGGGRKLQAVWSVLTRAAAADHKLTYNGTYTEAPGHRLIGPTGFTACTACMLREAGYAACPPRDLNRRVRVQRSRRERKHRKFMRA